MNFANYLLSKYLFSTVVNTLMSTFVLILKSIYYRLAGFFDDGYLTEHPEIKNLHISPIRHFILIGKNLGFGKGLTPNQDVFFEEGYLELYPYVRKLKISAWEHYVLYGKNKGLDNGLHPDKSIFFPEGYLMEYPEISELNILPWVHYVLKGKSEGRDNGLNPSKELFFKEGYATRYPDVLRKGYEPWEHYAKFGKQENRNNGHCPSISYFSEQEYVKRYPDVLNTNLTPWEHYVFYGKDEGRVTNSRMEATVRFSIIMPTYNRAHQIKNAISSVLNQKYDGFFELIIVDDGSTDNTIELIESDYSQELKTGKIVLKKSNHVGVSAARNIGLASATGNWICYLDSDNAMYSHFLRTFFHKIIHNQRSFFFYGKMLRKNSKVVFGEKYDRGNLIIDNFIDMGTLCHSISLYETLGGFDTSLKRFVDWDLAIRYTAISNPFYIDEILLEYNDDNDSSDRISNKENFITNFLTVRSKNISEFVFSAKKSVD